MVWGLMITKHFGRENRGSKVESGATVQQLLRMRRLSGRFSMGLQVTHVWYQYPVSSFETR